MLSNFLVSKCSINNSQFSILNSSLTIAFACLWLACRAENDRSVIAYVSQDQVYAEPIFKEFTAKTGIKVKAVYDSEAVKTVGLAQRLLAERNQPRCDLFWNNEELRTRQLAAEGLFRENEGWTAFGFRQRVVVVNTNFVPAGKAAIRLADFTNAVWKGRLALAYPVFGTTATHFMVLAQEWGQEPWQAWIERLQANSPMLVDGNSMVVKLVARGEVWAGLTDSDDALAGQREGLPIQWTIPPDGRFEIRNTVALLRNAPHPTEAEQLRQFLTGPETVKRLIQAEALLGSDAPDPSIDWDQLLGQLAARTAIIQATFVR